MTPYRAAYATLPGHACGLCTVNIVVTSNANRAASAWRLTLPQSLVVASAPQPDVLHKAT